MEDVQGRRDHRGVSLKQAGVSDLSYPIVVLDRSRERQTTIARIAMSVGVPHDFKGTHMSRFIEVLEAHRGEITMRTLPGILQDVRKRLNAETARIEVQFPYFVEKSAPVSGATALMDYQCAFVGESNGGELFMVRVCVPVTSLCPCSKEISDYGAHNQRSYVTIEVRGAGSAEELIWIEELIAIGEGASSAPVYPLLKRPDERHITMQAYDHPAFVEDIARDVAIELQADPRVAWFRVHVRSDESIHNHCAFAEVDWSRPAK